MTDGDCVFCKIINKEIPSDFVYEDEKCVAFRDIKPMKRVHILLVPKEHIPSIADMREGDEKTLGHLIKVAREIAAKEKLEGYQLQFNVGAKGGQIIFHIHLHLLAD